MNETDALLVERYLRSGDEHALEELVARYLSAILGYVRTLTGNGNTAADIAQETFVKVWKNLKRYNPNMEFKGWLFTIAKRTAIDELRKNHAVPFSVIDDKFGGDFAHMIVDEGPTVATLIASVMTGRALSMALVGLSPVPAAIVDMKTSHDMTFSQIARKLRIPLNTVKSHYRRALLLLRQRIVRE